MSFERCLQELLEPIRYIWKRSTEDITADLSRYTTYQVHTTRLISIISSSISIFSGVTGLYFFLAIDYRKRVFRHQLIAFLILYDWIKAICLLLYPARVISDRASYYDVKSCKAVGFFTAFSIEGSDIAILSFAIHVALLIFRPNLRMKRGMNYEGGLYRYRYFVYIISVLVPILLASLAFINGVGYAPLTNWCYIPSRPIWYRLVLSWGPRYLIIVSIFVIYGCVYHHVTKGYNKVGNTMIDSNAKRNKNRSIWRYFRKALWFIFLFDVFLSNDSINNDKEDNDEDGNIECLSSDRNMHDFSKESHGISIQGSLKKETVDQFQIRKSQVERQMRAIFIYPVSYVFLWIFPLIVHAMDFATGVSIKPIYWLIASAAFMQPFNCTIDTIVFFIREKPWKITTIEVYKSFPQDYEYARWRRAISFLPLFKLPTSSALDIDDKAHVQSPDVHNIQYDKRNHDFSTVLLDSRGLNFTRIESKNFINDKRSYPKKSLRLNSSASSKSKNTDTTHIPTEDNIFAAHSESPSEFDITDFLKRDPE